MSAQPHDALAAALSIIPSLPRPMLSRLIARAIDHLDEVDGDPDLEDDDPAGDPCDLGEPEEWRPDGITLAKPIYGVDQSSGPVNEAAAHRAYMAELIGATRGAA